MSETVQKTALSIIDTVAEALCGELLRSMDSIGAFAANNPDTGLYETFDNIIEFPDMGVAVCYDLATDISSIKKATGTEGDVYVHRYEYVDEVEYTVSICNVSIYNTVSGDSIQVPETLASYLKDGVGGTWNQEQF